MCKEQKSMSEMSLCELSVKHVFIEYPTYRHARTKKKKQTPFHPKKPSDPDKNKNRFFQSSRSYNSHKKHLIKEKENLSIYYPILLFYIIISLTHHLSF